MPPAGTGAVGQELGGEHLPERWVVATPPDPDQVEIECGGTLLVLTDGPNGTAPRVGAAQHKPADPLGMARRVGHRNGAALRNPQQRKAFQPKCFHHRFQVGDPVVEREVGRLPIRESARTSGGPSPTTAYANRTPSAARQNAMCCRGKGCSSSAGGGATISAAGSVMAPTNW